MFGRRPDGIRTKMEDPLVRIVPYLMPMRCDAQVFFKHKVDLEALNDYLRRQKKEKGEKLSAMHVIMAAYVRAMSHTPEINRFIMNKQLFSRNNCSISLTILKDPSDLSKGEAVVKIKCDLTDTIYDVRDRLDALIAENRKEEEKGFIDKLLNFLFAIPGLATVVVAIVRVLDRYGIAPAVLMEELPFYSGMFITNTASIGLHDVNHHIYNWGNVNLFLGMGMPEKVAVVEKGETRMKKYLPVGITADERICGGAQWSRFFNDLRHYVEHPELLEEPPAPDTIRFDPKCEYHVPKVQK